VADWQIGRLADFPPYAHNFMCVFSLHNSLFAIIFQPVYGREMGDALRNEGAGDMMIGKRKMR
jgi:hypothetical protein